MSVKVSYPLKQGLKPVQNNVAIDAIDIVKVSYPLKQGLKLSTGLPLPVDVCS